MRVRFAKAALVSIALLSAPAFGKTQNTWSEGSCYIQPFGGNALFKPSHEVVYTFDNRSKGFAEKMRLYLKPGEKVLDLFCSKDMTLLVTDLRISVMAGGEDVFFNSDKTMDSSSFKFRETVKFAAIGQGGTMAVLDQRGRLFFYRLKSSHELSVTCEADLGTATSVFVRDSKIYRIDEEGKERAVCDMPR